ncbi:hypothetical protein PENSPDRAFT_690447 [Peniophora sp. CONT]|nr:hypothetical protein PENSPDRAFT_690447 [Peniophora sp. CONT]
MDEDFEQPCDLSVFFSEESDAREYVVLRGYNPGCTDKLGAIISTQGIDNSSVVRMNSAAAALRRWRYELTFGNQVLCLGSDIEEQRVLYMDTARSALMEAVADISQTPTAITPVNSPAATPVNGPDSTTVQEQLLASEITLEDHTSTSEIATLDSHVRTDGCSSDRSAGVSSQPVLVASVANATTLSLPTAPRNYAPPQEEGVDFRPNDLPEPTDVRRGTEGRFPWYVVKKSRAPGIYASWEEAYRSNRVHLWVAVRSTNEVQQYS